MSTEDRSPLAAPTLLTSEPALTGFACGEPSFDDWLKRRALANQVSGASRTYVVCEGRRVMGFYCLASGAIAAAEAPSKVRRNMPDPIPMMVIGRLAIDQRWHGRGIGRALLRDAVRRTLQAAGIVGVRGILVHALSSNAKKFCEACGFQEFPSNPNTLLVTFRDTQAALVEC